MIICFNYSKLSINALSVIISTLIFSFIQLLNVNNLSIDIVSIRENKEQKILSENIDIIVNEKKENFWKIEIPKINLNARNSRRNR